MSILASEIDNRVGEQGQGLQGTSDVERATPRIELGNRLLCFHRLIIVWRSLR